MPLRIEFGILTNTSPQESAADPVRAPVAHSGFVLPTLADYIKRPSSERLWLRYELLPGPFPEQWAAAFVQEVSRKSLWHFNFGSLFVDEPYYRNKISRRLKALRQSRISDSAINESDITPYIKRKILELILSECNEIKLNTKGKGAAGKTADELSDLVRHYLQIYHPEFHFHISLQAYVPQCYHLPAEAHSLFTCDREDGWLYLDYIGHGQSSLAAYGEKSVVEHDPQTLFSANSQILYRENFNGRSLQSEAAKWLASQNQPSQSIGLIPLARPLHDYSRIQVREIFSRSDTTVEIRIFRDDKRLNWSDLKAGNLAAKPFFAGGTLQAATQWLLRTSNLDLPVNFFIDCHHRYGGSLWMVKQPYYWLKPRAYRTYFTLSWPIRIVIYYFQYQISVGFIDYRTLAKVYTGRLAYALKWPFHLIRPHASRLVLFVSFPVRYLYYVDWPTVTKVAWGRFLSAASRFILFVSLPVRHLYYIDWPTVTKVHWGRLCYTTFKIYFTISRPVRKVFYFAKFQFEKRVLRSRK